MMAFFTHLGAQLTMAAATAAVTALAGHSYADLGAWAPAAQGLAALLATTFNKYFVHTP